jgi:hypothetical protein
MHHGKKGIGKQEEEIMTEQAKEFNLNAKGTPEREGKYLSFCLDAEEYGIGILKVKEIIGMMSITPVPQTPEFVKGEDPSEHRSGADKRRTHAFGQSCMTKKGKNGHEEAGTRFTAHSGRNPHCSCATGNYWPVCSHEGI